MCGICGSVNLRDDGHLARMTDSLAHRGPDDRGVDFFPAERVGLGHRRLSIIDLSAAGHQPMSNADESLWIVFNGEIYNFLDLRSELEQKGHRFRSQTDTEVILVQYEEEGAECFARLNGMFAFALLDRRRQKLLLARDHFGIKPLYYYQDKGRFVFGSEIKAILTSGIYSPDINWQGLHDYFTYLYVPTPETMFRGIRQVPLAHVLELDLRTNETSLRRFWQPQGANGANGNGAGKKSSLEDDKRELRELLADSVRRQMISDVPLGVFLSGGVDSPVLTGLMAQTSTQPVKTFTIVFQGKNVEFYDERDIARQVARKFSTEHHEIPVDLAEPLEMLNLVDHFDQPFGNPTFYLMYLISKHTRPEATVALCGAGGDELFAGYPRYRAMALARMIRHIPKPLLGGLRRALDYAKDDYRTMTIRRARQFLDGLDDDFARQFVNWTYFLNEGQKRALLRQVEMAGDGVGTVGCLPSERIVRRSLDESRVSDFGNRVLHVDVQTFLPDNILEYTDKMSMAVSLEVRVPYLDYRFVERSLRVPFEHKLRGGKGKAILKDMFADMLPAENIKAPKKGFNFPLAVWMRDHFDGYFDRHMGEPSVRQEGILNWEYIQLLRAQHRSGKADNSYALFSIIMFDVWYRKYIKN
ncbi:MAG TPA: asparagine synthase (glutamine-hydrolyzing) [Pyrinomonadaceae bacterium]|jgi:asparagine synthase (glutamine-hydrolysing)|nr:asparagine synthase (glutamine-hydrolyzing) [Pyrinomonadaceae bacterium]